MKKIIFPTKEKEIEEAILMLTDQVRKNCRNPKPLILHCLRVGMKLFEIGQPKEVVIAGILHDLIEDTDCTLKEIENKFGKKVADLVAALTQEDVDDYKERWQILMRKIKKAGKGAMMIKIIDAKNNLPYMLLMKDEEKIERTLWKHQLIIKKLGKYLVDWKIFKDYEGEYQKIYAHFNKK